jgi:hypothetical protein
MHFTATDERYNGALRRLAVILLALAGIAERAADRSWPLRSLVLWLLGKAEARVRGFAVRAGAGALPIEFRAGAPGGIAYAARLAKKFRALAAMIFALARRGPQWLRIARRLTGNRRNVVRFAARPFNGDRLYADTS